MKNFGFLLATAALFGASACVSKPHELVRRPNRAPFSVLIRNVDIFDSVNGKIDRAKDVMIVGDRIEAIGPAGSLGSSGSKSSIAQTVIEGTGGTLLPGLIDAHAHMGSNPAPPWVGGLGDYEANFRAFLYCGVTTVADMGDSNPKLLEYRDAIARGQGLGPNLYCAGKLITAPEGHPLPIVRNAVPWWLEWFIIPKVAHQVATLEEATAAVREIKANGSDFVKIVVDDIPDGVNVISDEALAAVIKEADAQGLSSVAHIGSTRDALASADAGIDSWIHGVYEESIPEADIAKMASAGIPMTPTLVVWHAAADYPLGNRKATELERQTQSQELLNSFNSPPLDSATFDFFGDWLGMLDRVRPEWAGNVKRLHEAGVVIMAGSDNQQGVLPGASLHRELHFLHEAGLTNAEVLQAATINSARFFSGTEIPEYGVVLPRKRADLVLVNGDPLADLNAVSDIREVILGGAVLVREALAEGD